MNFSPSFDMLVLRGKHREGKQYPFGDWLINRIICSPLPLSLFMFVLPGRQRAQVLLLAVGVWFVVLPLGEKTRDILD